MNLKIKELKGGEVSVTVDPSHTVHTLKTKIEEQIKVPVAEIKLLLSGKVLQDDKTLHEYQVTEASKIMLTRIKVDLKMLIQKSLGKFYDSEKGE
jgi:Ubiquitin family